MSNEIILYLVNAGVCFMASLLLLVRYVRELPFWHNVALFFLCALSLMWAGVLLSEPRIGQTRDTCVGYYVSNGKCADTIKEIYAPTERGPKWLEVK